MKVKVHIYDETSMKTSGACMMVTHLYSQQLVRSVGVAALGRNHAVIAHCHAVQPISHLQTLQAQIDCFPAA